MSGTPQCPMNKDKKEAEEKEEKKEAEESTEAKEAEEDKKAEDKVVDTSILKASIEGIEVDLPMMPDDVGDLSDQEKDRLSQLFN